MEKEGNFNYQLSLCHPMWNNFDTRKVYNFFYLLFSHLPVF